MGSSKLRYFNFGIFKKLDLVSPPVQLYVGGNERHNSWMGVIFTFIYGLIMMYALTFELDSYLRNDMPLSVRDSYTRSEYPQVQLMHSNLLPLFFGYKNEVDTIDADEVGRWFTFSTIKVTWNTTTQDDGEVVLKKQIMNFETVPCKYLTEEQKMAYEYIEKGSYLSEMFDTVGICIRANENYYVMGKGSDDIFETINYRLMPCSLESGCATFDEMKIANFVLAMPTSNMDASNFEKPHFHITNADDIYYINPFVRQIYSAKIRENQVKDLLGLIDLSYKERTTYFDLNPSSSNMGYRNPQKITCTMEEIYTDSSDCQSYFEFLMMSSGTVGVYKRSYTSIMDVLGNLGGFNGILMFLLLAVYAPVNDVLKKRFFREHLYSFIYHESPGMETVRQENKSKLLSRAKTEPSERPPVELNPLPAIATDNKVAADSSSATTVQPDEKQTLQEQYDNLKSFLPKVCRKKTQKEKELSYMESAANEHIEESLDILNILRELGTLKVLTHLLLRPRHLGLAPLVGFKAWTREKEGAVGVDRTDNEKLKQLSSKLVKPIIGIGKKIMLDYGPGNLSFVEQEETNYREWIGEIERVNERECIVTDQARKSMEKLTDDYYKNYLVAQVETETKNSDDEDENVKFRGPSTKKPKPRSTLYAARLFHPKPRGDPREHDPVIMLAQNSSDQKSAKPQYSESPVRRINPT